MPNLHVRLRGSKRAPRRANLVVYRRGLVSSCVNEFELIEEGPITGERGAGRGTCVAKISSNHRVDLDERLGSGAFGEVEA